MSVSLLQLSDSHLFRAADQRLLGIDTSASLVAVVDAAGAEGEIDALIATGDLSQDRSAESYDRFATAIVALGAPVYWLPGNHDDPGPFHQRRDGFPLPPRRPLALGDWQLILLDSVVAGSDGGQLAAAELAYLQNELAASAARHVLIAMHHHPLPSGCAWLDGMQLANSAELWSLVEQDRRVRGILCGHVHQAIDRPAVNGLRVLASPSTCFQFLPGSDAFAVDDSQPGYRHLRLHDDGTIETRVVRLAGRRFIADPTAGGY